MEIERVIELAIRKGVEIGCAQTMKNLGVTSGELSERQAVKVYGTWFKWAVANNKVHPSRVGNGKNGTRWYSVTDLLSLKAAMELKAEISH